MIQKKIGANKQIYMTKKRILFLVTLIYSLSISVYAVDNITIQGAVYDKTSDTQLFVVSEFDRARVFSSASSVPDQGVCRHVKATLYEINNGL